MKTTRIFTEAVNLRRDADSPQVWRRVGSPKQVSSTDALPFVRFSPLGDNRELVFFTGPGNELYHRVEIDGEVAPGSAGVLKHTGSLPGAPILADRSMQGVIRLLISHAPDQYITYDSYLNVSFHGAMPALPEICFSAGEFNTLYETVAPLKLTGTSVPAPGGSLAAGDEALLTANLISSYDALRSRCRSMNYCLQPVLTRYRLLDAAGNTVALGPTVMIGSPEGFGCTENIVQTSSDGLIFLTAGKLTANVYRPCLIAPQKLPAPWNRLVSKLIIEMTDEIEPLDRNVAAGYGMRYQAASEITTITSLLPGFSRGTVLDRSRLQRLVQQALSAGMRTVAEYSFPFGGKLGDEGEMLVLPSVSDSPLQKPSAGEEGLQGRIRTYSAGVETSGVTVLCNPLYEPLKGWSPSCFVAGRENGTETATWRLASSVKIANPVGSMAVMQEISGTGNPPASFGPLLTFPSTDATEMTLTFEAPSGKVYEETFPLTSDPVAGLARYVHHGAERIVLQKIVAQYKPASTELRPYLEEGIAEVFPTADLRKASSRIKIMEGEITAVKVAPRSRSSWDFSRRKLLFFGEGGIYLATLNGAGEFHAVAPIDNRSVRCREAVCEATTPDGAALIALAGGDLVEIGGQKVSTMKRGIGGVALGWCECFKEIWIADGGSLRRFTADKDIIGVSLPGLTDGGASLRLASSRGELLAAGEGGVYALSLEDAVDSLEISLHQRFRVEGLPRQLTVECLASLFNGRFILRGDRGTEIPEELLRLEIEGALNEAVSLRLASPRRPWLELTISGEVSADLAINPFKIECYGKF